MIMARFYVVLPILSRTLSKVLLKSSHFSLEMEEKAPELLAAAKGLRHAELLKDPLLLCLGPWQKPVSARLEDAELCPCHGFNQPA